MQNRCSFIDLEYQPYAQTYEWQKVIRRRRIGGSAGDVLLFVEHGPTLTVGRSGRLHNILASREELERQGLGLYQIERGGDVTYHGPGQLVVYPILDLSKRNKDLNQYVFELEEVVIKSLAAYNVRGQRKKGFPGVWVDGEKIAALGVAVKKWVTMHGFAFNVSCNLDHFSLIVPCGIAGCKVTSLEKVLGVKPDFAKVKNVVAAAFQDVIAVELYGTSLETALGE